MSDIVMLNTDAYKYQPAILTVSVQDVLSVYLQHNWMSP